MAELGLSPKQTVHAVSHVGSTEEPQYCQVRQLRLLQYCYGMIDRLGDRLAMIFLSMLPLSLKLQMRGGWFRATKLQPPVIEASVSLHVLFWE